MSLQAPGPVQQADGRVRCVMHVAQVLFTLFWFQKETIFTSAWSVLKFDWHPQSLHGDPCRHAQQSLCGQNTCATIPDKKTYLYRKPSTATRAHTLSNRSHSLTHSRRRRIFRNSRQHRRRTLSAQPVGLSEHRVLANIIRRALRLDGDRVVTFLLPYIER